jgi:hypothetical protein
MVMDQVVDSKYNKCAACLHTYDSDDEVDDEGVKPIIKFVLLQGLQSLLIPSEDVRIVPSNPVTQYFYKDPKKDFHASSSEEKQEERELFHATYKKAEHKYFALDPDLVLQNDDNTAIAFPICHNCRVFMEYEDNSNTPNYMENSDSEPDDEPELDESFKQFENMIQSGNVSREEILHCYNEYLKKMSTTQILEKGCACCGERGYDIKFKDVMLMIYLNCNYSLIKWLNMKLSKPMV